MIPPLYIDGFTLGQMADIEERLCSNVGSPLYLLRDDERLVDTIARDVVTVSDLGTTCVDLAHGLSNLLSNIPESREAIIGKYAFRRLPWDQIHVCPFGGYECDISTVFYRVSYRNPTKISEVPFTISAQMPHLIKHHQFFGGSTPNRADPIVIADILSTIDFRIRAHAPKDDARLNRSVG